MARWRTILGCTLTVLWLGAMGLLWKSQHGLSTALTLNEWGDFYAGVFAPLAFLWLVLGYLQQGEELRNSGRALHLQAEELKNSVEQQSRLVDVSRKQLEQEIQAIKFQREVQEAALLPRFTLAGAGSSSGPEGTRLQLNLHNVGNFVTNVNVAFTPPCGWTTGRNIAVLNHFNSETIELNFKEELPTSVLVIITYRDAASRLGTARFQFAPKPALGGDWDFVELTPPRG